MITSKKRNLLVWYLLMYSMHLLCMHNRALENIESTQMMLYFSLPFLDLPSISNLLQITRATPYVLDLRIVNSLDDYLCMYRERLKSLTPCQHTNALMHYAQKDEEVLFDHLMHYESTDNYMKRKLFVSFMGYSNTQDRNNNLKAFKGVVFCSPASSRTGFLALLDHFSYWFKYSRKSIKKYYKIVCDDQLYNHVSQLFIKQIIMGLDTHKKEVNARNYCDETLLHIAVTHNIAKLVSYLLVSGAALSLVNMQGDTAFDMACLKLLSNKEYLPLVQLLILNGAEINRQADEDNVKYCVEQYRLEDRGNSVRYRGDTILHRVARSNHARSFAVAHLLMQHGADFSLKNSDGKTPLDVAKTYHNWGVVNLFETSSRAKL